MEDRNVGCFFTSLLKWTSLLKYILVPLIFPKIHGLAMVHASQIFPLLLAPVLAAKKKLKKIKSKGNTKIQLHENHTSHGSVRNKMINH